jgi:hypothetical protein
MELARTPNPDSHPKDSLVGRWTAHLRSEAGRVDAVGDGAPQRLIGGQESLEPDASPGVFL